MNPFVDVFPAPPPVPSNPGAPPPDASKVREDRKILQNLRSLSTSIHETTVLTNGMTVSEFCLAFIRAYHFRQKRPGK